MDEIYLISHTQNQAVKNLKVCEIEFLKFSVDLSKFEALVITSKNSIKALKFNNIKKVNLKVFSIGDGSTKEALKYGFSDIYTAKNSHGNEFANEIASFLKGKKTLFLKAEKTVSDVGGILIKNGAILTKITAYKNNFLNLDESLKPPLGSILIFSSPSNVEGFIKNFGKIDESYKVVVIGNATAKLLSTHKNLIISEKQSIDKCLKLAKNLINQ
ncbi:uroporphyrinogen-III synthase [Campylobacter ureolyticus]|uniref:Uroporphyrinogen-III synthase n=1 Tax=Campylobacter ureolyticus TaxID=827 RepID=A0A9Q4KMR9_9BACT|nr:uroporphyrinogen-III synthase [Campylobacter ureolyticus]MCZ6150199.1 uroporphyrinogen-III synthase [Campylobacter ureolyticus]MCZ6159418.1 uroporphyrinogen-III synthase [Campylobacter ureolyticus]MCZ6163677.1 uroporphyrinogen-III synthase [Campylobacter ureolyticus]MCZ6165241.1 uroporphyrinogen-III synthase [Campylobacter ureolyticus]MCZ6166712.1 uroporphyrinogen-III synthase [Campylobacter ureolyticus]